MNNLGLVIEVNCKCGKGKVVLTDVNFNEKEMTCTICDKKELINDYFIDELMDTHTYNTSISEDVKVLNKNGVWECAHSNQSINQDELCIMLDGFNVICKVDGKESFTYYRKGFEFIEVINDHSQRNFIAYKFVANEDNMNNLITHFFNKI